MSSAASSASHSSLAIADGRPDGGRSWRKLGLAGTNVGDGSPENVDLDSLLAPGDHDYEPEEELTGYAGDVVGLSAETMQAK